MLLASVAAATLALGLSADTKPSAVATTFAQYCGIAAEGGQPYCADRVPESVQWLVLYSLCSAKDRHASYGTVCDTFASSVAASDAAARRFLSFDPRFARWSGVTFSAAKGGECTKGTADGMKWYCRTTQSDWLAIDETGLATVTRAASDDIPVVVVGVNPLLYKTTAETVTSEDIESLAALQQIALGLGAVLQESIGLFGRAKLDSNAFRALSNKTPLLVLPSATKAEPAALTEILVLRDEVLQRMADAATRLADEAGAADIARSQAIVAIQDAEQRMARAGTNLTVAIQGVDSARLSYANLQTAYDELDAAYRGVRDFGDSCRPLLKEFLFIVQHANDAPSVLRPRIAAFIARYGARTACTNAFAGLGTLLVSDAKALQPLNDTGFRTAIAEMNITYNAGLTLIVSPPPKSTDAEEDEPAPLDAALDLLATKRTAALSVYNSLATAGMRREDYTFNGTLMMTWLYVAPKTDQLPWSKVQTHAFSLKRNAPLSSSVTGALAEETELNYRLQSNKGTGIGVGLGVIYTKIAEPVFGAVTNPENNDEKVVSQTDTSTLAGQLAVFADWRFLSLINSRTERWFLRPSLQVGTNVSTTPGFFVGIGADVFKYFRVGWGRTFQQSKRLSASQILDQTVIGSVDDIKTEDFFAKARYFSFSLAIDALPIFKRGGSAGGSSTKEQAKETDAAAAAEENAAKAREKKTGGAWTRRLRY